MIYVLYHTACYDGFGAAFAAWKKFGNSARYIPVGYGHPMPAIPNASELYVVDFSYDEELLSGIADTGVKVVVLDHHKTAEKKLMGLMGLKNPEVVFDMDRSGAGITWDYFHGAETRPRIIDLIEDRDLWKFEYGEVTKNFHSFLLSQPFEFHVYDNLVDNPSALVLALKEGEALLRMTDQIVDKICKNARIEIVHGHTVAVVNTSSHWSEVGNKLLDLYPQAHYAMTYTDLKDETRMFSLRSKAPFDVSKIAEQFGGGGHAQAAGYKAKPTVAFANIEYRK